MVEGTQRRLAAIVSADVVGYSRLMGADETGTHVRLKARFSELVEPKIAEYGGRVVKLMGDGLLAEFPSITNAVTWAVVVQTKIAELNTDEPDEERIDYRVGVNLGEVIIDGDDIFGDGVNVAARLQEIAEPGGVCISAKVHAEVRGKLDYEFADGGSQSVKNIVEPIQVWRWPLDGQVSDKHSVVEQADQLPLPDKPSIAVLPFDNMSGDPEQVFFADGIAEDVITALSRFSSLFVIARNSSFTYKGQAVDIAQVGRDLGVRYVVEGSVRKAGNRVRITAQLIDAASGNHLWADRFDGSLDDVFDLQDQITEQIVVAVEPEIGAHEREQARRKPPENLDAWELVQRGLSHLYRFNSGDRAEAARLLKRAVAMAPEFAAAHAHLADALRSSASVDKAIFDGKTDASARAVAEKAVSLDPKEPVARYVLGRLHVGAGEFELAIGEFRAAIAINPNFARGHYGLGWSYYGGVGDLERALTHYEAAIRLSPRDPLRWLPLALKGVALNALGRHDEAVEFCRLACQVPDTGFIPVTHLAGALAEAGNKREALAMVNKAMQLQPALSIPFLRGQFSPLNETMMTILLDSLRKAGVPE